MEASRGRNSSSSELDFVVSRTARQKLSVPGFHATARLRCRHLNQAAQAVSSEDCTATFDRCPLVVVLRVEMFPVLAVVHAKSILLG
jgi:hypothetical protein